MVALTLKLPRHMAEALHDAGKEKDVTPGQVLRDLLAKELRRHANAKTPNRADERLVARLQRLLASDMAAASGWRDLQARLARHGYELRPAGGGLTLHRLSDGARLCKGSEIGFAYSRLVRRFGCAMPGHPHRMSHITCKRDAAAAFDLIEPF